MSENPNTFTVRGVALSRAGRNYELTWRRNAGAPEITGTEAAVSLCDAIRWQVANERIGIGLVIDRYRTGFDPYQDPEYALAVILRVIEPASAIVEGYTVPVYDIPPGAIG